MARAWRGHGLEGSIRGATPSPSPLDAEMSTPVQGSQNVEGIWTPILSKSPLPTCAPIMCSGTSAAPRSSGRRRTAAPRRTCARARVPRGKGGRGLSGRVRIRKGRGLSKERSRPMTLPGSSPPHRVSSDEIDVEQPPECGRGDG
eukprot:gene9529-biopygen13778